jgi:itaconate CoA-transferase
MRPLDGVTVVALEHVIAGPFCTRQLADLGARIIKIERPGVGDPARAYDDRVHGMSSHFVWTNRSKESITLDLKQEAARRIVDRLLENADVLVQNLAPGAAARMGYGYDALKDRNPRLIVCDISGYGADGPYRDKKAYDLLMLDRRHRCRHVCLRQHSRGADPARAHRHRLPHRHLDAGKHGRVDELPALLRL